MSEGDLHPLPPLWACGHLRHTGCRQADGAANLQMEGVGGWVHARKLRVFRNSTGWDPRAGVLALHDGVCTKAVAMLRGSAVRAGELLFGSRFGQTQMKAAIGTWPGERG